MRKATYLDMTVYEAALDRVRYVFVDAPAGWRRGCR
jgi:hypothetical protein